ncbi:hypothetical protein GOODEAATRI_016748 [Goodea atripinnis]|uniref:Uncharacterized protein n=1 Tax=Goodea atripinnis TaxID=208336 RepID=A0ABV0P4Q1_9TELE
MLSGATNQDPKGKRPLLCNTAWPLLDVEERIWANCKNLHKCCYKVSLRKGILFPPFGHSPQSVLSFKELYMIFGFIPIPPGFSKERTTNTGKISSRIICLSRDLWTWGGMDPL